MATVEQPPLDLSEVPGTGNCCGLWLADKICPSRLCQPFPADLPDIIMNNITNLRWSTGCVFCPESLVPTEQRPQFGDMIFIRTGRSCNEYEAILPETVMEEIRELFPLASFEHEAALLLFLEENRYRTPVSMLVDCVRKFPASMFRQMLLIKAENPGRWADEILFELAEAAMTN